MKFNFQLNQSAFVVMIIMLANVNVVAQTDELKRIEAEWQALANYQPSAGFVKKGDYRPFGSARTNFDRFRNSPCYDALGFQPYEIGTSEYNSQVKRYENCENELNHPGGETALYVIVVLVTIGLVALAFYLIKDRQSEIEINGFKLANHTGNKAKSKSMESDYMDIGEALSKLNELKEAFDADLIDEETFNSQKSKIQQKLKIDPRD